MMKNTSDERDERIKTNGDDVSKCIFLFLLMFTFCMALVDEGTVVRIKRDSVSHSEPNPTILRATGLRADSRWLFWLESGQPAACRTSNVQVLSRDSTSPTDVTG